MHGNVFVYVIMYEYNFTSFPILHLYHKLLFAYGMYILENLNHTQ